jgi:hypothetical protein
MDIAGPGTQLRVKTSRGWLHYQVARDGYCFGHVGVDQAAIKEICVSKSLDSCIVRRDQGTV